MAVDCATGCIYMTDNSTKKIIKLSPDLNLLCQLDLKANSKPRGIAVVGDEVMMCDRDKCVMVYTKELKYVRKVTGSGQVSSWFYIASDEFGNLYITDADWSLIHVFSHSGKFIRSFGKQLHCPYGVCVSGQYVYVANFRGGKITVFTMNGEYVASFGEFENPWGVCVDKGAFLYVCDYKNKIPIF